MNSQRIAIITDSGTDTPRAFAAEHDVRIVPLIINYQDGSYRAGVDITTEEVVRRFEHEIPTTSLPTPEAIRQAFEEARADGYEKAVFVTISSGLSATNQTVHLVARDLDNFPVAIVDTKSIGIGAGVTTMAAVRLVEDGVPFEELEGRLTSLAEKSTVLFCVKDLIYLRKGGRISEAVYRLGSMLNIKPIIYCDAEGYYKPLKKARGWDKALDLEVATIAELASKYDDVIVAICCSDAENLFDQLETKLRAKVPNISTLLKSGISPDLVVHTGPNLVGIAVQPTKA